MLFPNEGKFHFKLGKSLPPHRIAIRNQFNRAQFVCAQNGCVDGGGAIQYFCVRMTEAIICTSRK